MKPGVGALLVLAGCAREAREPPPAPPPAPYQVVALEGAGRIDGTAALPDSLPPEGIVVWLDDVRAGKPLARSRRYELDHEQQALVPRVQAVTAGGTLNVRNMDDAVHHARFTLTGVAGASDSVLGVVEETGAGQLVPAQKEVARAGLVVVTCDDHAATRAWIRVFDHPYFAMPDRAGRFAIDSVPAGRWHLRAWHPEFGARELWVTVDSAGDAIAEVRFSP